MLSKKLVVWRELLAGASTGQRRWQSVSALAVELGMPVSSAHRSLAHPVEIGAVEVSAMEGLVLLDPYRLLLLLAAHRRLERDVVGHTHLAATVDELEAAIHAQAGCVLGGFSAAVAHAGANRIADYETVLVYGTPMLEGFAPAKDGRATELLIAESDPRVGRHGRVTTYAQAWADLFCMRGWQAARFVDQLDPKEVWNRRRADEEDGRELVAHALRLSVVGQRGESRVQTSLAVDDHGVEVDHVPPPPLERRLEPRMVEGGSEDRRGGPLERVEPGTLHDVVTDPRAVLAPVARGLSDEQKVRGPVAGAALGSRVGEGLDQVH